MCNETSSIIDLHRGQLSYFCPLKTFHYITIIIREKLPMIQRPSTESISKQFFFLNSFVIFVTPISPLAIPEMRRELGRVSNFKQSII